MPPNFFEGGGHKNKKQTEQTPAINRQKCFQIASCLFSNIVNVNKNNGAYANLLKFGLLHWVLSYSVYFPAVLLDMIYCSRGVKAK